MMCIIWNVMACIVCDVAWFHAVVKGAPNEQLKEVAKWRPKTYVREEIRLRLHGSKL